MTEERRLSLTKARLEIIREALGLALAEAAMNERTRETYKLTLAWANQVLRKKSRQPSRKPRRAPEP